MRTDCHRAESGIEQRLRSARALGVEERSDETPRARASGARPCAGQVVAKPKRRQFTAEYRLRILEEADRCTQPGEVGRLLHREGMYSSHRRLGARRGARARCGSWPRPNLGAKPAYATRWMRQVRALERKPASHGRHELAHAHDRRTCTGADLRGAGEECHLERLEKRSNFLGAGRRGSPGRPHCWRAASSSVGQTVNPVASAGHARPAGLGEAGRAGPRCARPGLSSRAPAVGSLATCGRRPVPWSRERTNRILAANLRATIRARWAGSSPSDGAPRPAEGPVLGHGDRCSGPTKSEYTKRRARLSRGPRCWMGADRETRGSGRNTSSTCQPGRPAIRCHEPRDRGGR